MIKLKLWSKHDFNWVFWVYNLWSTNCLQSLGRISYLSPERGNCTTERSLKPAAGVPFLTLKFTGCKMVSCRVVAGVKWDNGRISTYRYRYYCFTPGSMFPNFSLPKQSFSLLKTDQTLKTSKDLSKIQWLPLFPPTPSPTCSFLSKELSRCIWIRNFKY